MINVDKTIFNLFSHLQFVQFDLIFAVIKRKDKIQLSACHEDGTQ